jgi:hypothetical protein
MGRLLRPSRRRIIAAALLLGGCSEPGESSSSDGAFPDRRVTFENEGRLLGYVSNRLSDAVSVLDLDGMTELGRVPVGRSPVDIDGPTHLAIDRERGYVYVALSYPAAAVQGPHAAHASTSQPGFVEVLALSNLRKLGEIEVAPYPADLALSADGERLVVSHYDLARAARAEPDIELRRATLSLVTPAFGIAGGSAVVESATTCVAPYAVAMGNDDTRAYVACSGEDSVAVVDVGTLEVDRVAVGSEEYIEKPFALSVDPSGSSLLVSSQVARSVELFGLDDGMKAGERTVVRGVPYYAAWLSEERIVVPTQGPNGASLLDVESLEILNEVTYTESECQNPHEARVAGDRLFLVCQGDGYAPGAVVELDPESLAVIARVEVGLDADRLLVLPP